MVTELIWSQSDTDTHRLITSGVATAKIQWMNQKPQYTESSIYKFREDKKLIAVLSLA